MKNSRKAVSTKNVSFFQSGKFLKSNQVKRTKTIRNIPAIDEEIISQTKVVKNLLQNFMTKELSSFSSPEQNQVKTANSYQNVIKRLLKSQVKNVAPDWNKLLTTISQNSSEKNLIQELLARDDNPDDSKENFVKKAECKPKRESVDFVMNEVEENIVLLKNKCVPLKNNSERKLEKIANVNESNSMSEEDWEDLEKNEPSKFVIFNISWFNLVWSFFLTLIVIYYILIAPLLLAYDNLRNLNLLMFELIIEVFYVIDTFLNFFITIKKDELEILKTKIIASNYFRGNFCIDIITGLPVSTVVYLFSVYYPNTNFVRFFDRMILFGRFVKIRKANTIIDYFQSKQQKSHHKVNLKNNFTGNFKRFITFIVGFLAFTHLLSCVWIYVSKFDQQTNWLTMKLEGLTEEWAVYVSAIYFIWTSIFTVGYGDIHPVNLIERAFTNILLFVGILIYSFTVSSVGSLISSYDAITSRFLGLKNTLDSLKKQYKVHDLLYAKILFHIKSNPISQQTYNTEIFDNLPIRIKEKLLMNMFKNIIANVYFFNDKPAKFLVVALQNLKKMKIKRNEYVINEEEIVKEVFFVSKGFLTILSNKTYGELKVMKIAHFEHFGDILMSSKEKSPVNVKAKNNTTEVLTMSRGVFSDLCKDFNKELEKFLLMSAYNYVALLKLLQIKITRYMEQNHFGKSQINQIASFGRKKVEPYLSNTNLLTKLKIMARKSSQYIRNIAKQEDMLFPIREESGLSSFKFSNTELERIEEEQEFGIKEKENRVYQSDVIDNKLKILSSLDENKDSKFRKSKKQTKKDTEFVKFKEINRRVNRGISFSNKISNDPETFVMTRLKKHIKVHKEHKENNLLQRLDKILYTLKANL